MKQVMLSQIHLEQNRIVKIVFEQRDEDLEQNAKF